jgi:hypothetical protein
MHIPLALMVALAAGPNDAPPAACRDDARAIEIAYRLSDLPPEVRLDLMRLTRFSIGERPRPLRRSHVVIPEERGYLGSRFYRALRFQNVWYVQWESALTAGVQTIGYIGDARGRFHASPVLRFGGPPCETITAVLAGIVAPVDALVPRPD